MHQSPLRCSGLGERGPTHLVVVTVELRDDADEGEAHDGHQRQPPGERPHEDKVSQCLDAGAQEDVDVLRDQVADLGGVSRQAGDDVTWKSQQTDLGHTHRVGVGWG